MEPLSLPNQREPCKVEKNLHSRGPTEPPFPYNFPKYSFHQFDQNYGFIKLPLRTAKTCGGIAAHLLTSFAPLACSARLLRIVPSISLATCKLYFASLYTTFSRPQVPFLTAIFLLVSIDQRLVP